ncbi:MAG: hypothetical protein IJK19_06430 [Bacteroidales bacterium]|nr:hypothetical protein [Bacteroidales bacterium]
MKRKTQTKTEEFVATGGRSEIRRPDALCSRRCSPRKPQQAGVSSHKCA